MRHIIKSTHTPESLQGISTPTVSDSRRLTGYKADDVKSRLLADQHGKCAYCETRLVGDYGDIEHFRPKNGYTTYDCDLLRRPGYYWISNEWSNLILSCSKCNTSYKRNHFDLKDDSCRDIMHMNITREEPLLINPIREDPSEYICYDKHIALPRIIDGRPSEKGEYTIRLLGLNERRELLTARRQVWQSYTAWSTTRDIAQRNIDCAQSDSKDDAQSLDWAQIYDIATSAINRMQSPYAEFSGMLLHQASER